MKIIVTMTADELCKGKEILSGMIPSIDSYIPSERNQLETTCNIYDANYVIDPEIGVVSEIELKSHFVLWLTRKMKPFIAAIMALWNMFTDLIEDISIMAGDVTVIHNGVNINDELKTVIEHDSDYEESCTYTDEDKAESEEPDQLAMDPIYTVHYNGKSEAEIRKHIRFFFDTEEKAEEFITADPLSIGANNGEDISNYKDIYILYCHRSSTSYKDVTNMIDDGKWFEYRGFTIQKSDYTYFVINKDGSTCFNRAENLNDALTYIDAKLDCKRIVWRIYSTTDKSANRIFEKEDKASDFFTNARLHSLDPRMIHFEVPIYFDFKRPTECIIDYRDYVMVVADNGMTCTINDDKQVQHISIFDAMDYIDECCEHNEASV